MTDFVTLLDQHARSRPGKLALRAAGRDWTYAQLAQDSRRAATALQTCGVTAGDRVALLCYNTPGFLLALFGAWRLGAAVVPINHKLQAPEIDHILAHSQARVCVFDGALAKVVKSLAEAPTYLSTDSAVDGVECFDALLEKASPITASQAQDGELAQVLYTSGTTGKPKGCLHSHRNVLATAMSVAAGASLTRNDRTLIAMPIWHSSPLNNWTLGSLLVGATVVMLREYAPLPFLETLAQERITLTFGAPIAFLAPLSVVPDVSHYDLSAMRMWAYGGGPLGADMARRLEKAYRSDKFVQVYGMTETGPLGSILYSEDALRKAGSIGCSGCGGVAIEVRHPDGALCQAGEIGEIHLRSPAMMQGYLNDPAATAQAFDAQGWYRSGDLARIDEDGYMYIVDRLKDMIVTGGENVYSKEVEDVISAYPDVQDVAVIGRPHPEWGETVMALLVPQAGKALDIDSLQDYLQTKLARYKIPRIFEIKQSLPRTATGKLLKHALRSEQQAAAHPN